MRTVRIDLHHHFVIILLSFCKQNDQNEKMKQPIHTLPAM